MTTLRYATRATGDRTGNSWDNAKAIDAITGNVLSANPGDAFLIGFDRDREDPVFWSDTLLRVESSGEPANPIRISSGFVSEADHVQPSGTTVGFRRSGLGEARRVGSGLDGKPFALLTNGASDIDFAGFGFVGAPRSGFFAVGDERGGQFSRVTIRDVSGSFAGRVIETSENAQVTELLIEDCDAFGLVRGFARFYDLSNSVFRDLYLDAGMVDGGGESVAQLIHVRRGANVLFENVWLKNAVNGLATEERSSNYVQGDGIVCEEETTGFVLRNCHASGMGDGGFDMKSQAFLMEDCSARACKKGVRIWSRTENVLRRCKFTNPRTVGEQPSSVWCAGTAELADCFLQASGDSAIIYFTTGTGGDPHLLMRGGEIVTEQGAALIQGDAGILELVDVKVNGTRRTETITSQGGIIRA